VRTAASERFKLTQSDLFKLLRVVHCPDFNPRPYIAGEVNEERHHCSGLHLRRAWRRLFFHQQMGNPA
jgi:hypothetical protein